MLNSGPGFAPTNNAVSGFVPAFTGAGIGGKAEACGGGAIGRAIPVGRTGDAGRVLGSPLVPAAGGTAWVGPVSPVLSGSDPLVAPLGRAGAALVGAFAAAGRCGDAGGGGAPVGVVTAGVEPVPPVFTGGAALVGALGSVVAGEMGVPPLGVGCTWDCVCVLRARRRARISSGVSPRLRKGLRGSVSLLLL